MKIIITQYFLFLNKVIIDLSKIDNITIKEEYRGKGIGSNVVKNLLYMTNYQFDIGEFAFMDMLSNSELEKIYNYEKDGEYFVVTEEEVEYLMNLIVDNFKRDAEILTEMKGVN